MPPIERARGLQPGWPASKWENICRYSGAPSSRRAVRPAGLAGARTPEADRPASRPPVVLAKVSRQRVRAPDFDLAAPVGRQSHGHTDTLGVTQSVHSHQPTIGRLRARGSAGRPPATRISLKTRTERPNVTRFLLAIRLLMSRVRIDMDPDRAAVGRANESSRCNDLLAMLSPCLRGAAGAGPPFTCHVICGLARRRRHRRSAGSGAQLEFNFVLPIWSLAPELASQRSIRVQLVVAARCRLVRLGAEWCAFVSADVNERPAAAPRPPVR